jgi:DMSO reductase family type II enzyme molybdopterin subunit
VEFPPLEKETPIAYGDWRNVYRDKWRWDKVVKSSHFVNCWYQAHCAWNVYVKDGVVWREEQVAQYPQTNPDVPDPNPRGCQKGGCFSDLMYEAGRVKYPLKRVGPRGSGKWKRISWEDANREIADKMLDITVNEGTDRIVWDLGPLYTEGSMTAGHQRHVVLLDHTVLDMNTEIGDGHRGTGETFGKISFERSADDYFYSDLIWIWGSNPIYTQIPNAHYLLEARYKGAKLVCISPDFSASAVHADMHVPVDPGGDAALGLGIAQVLIAEDTIDRGFLTEQTDMPILVRDDTRLLLRNSDMKKGGSTEKLYFWDEKKKGPVIVPRRTLKLGGISPALEGHFEVTLANGEKVGVSTVFTLFKKSLEAYTPEKASALSGTPANLIIELAHQMANAKAAAMVTSSNMDKYYHGNLIERVQALVYALVGQYGKKGSGYVGFPWLDHDGLEPFITEMFNMKDMMSPAALKYIKKTIKDKAKWKLDGYTDEMIVYEQGRDVIKSGRMTSGAMFWYIHGGLLESSKKLQDWDPYAKRSAQEYVQESMDKGWQDVWPRPGNDPKMMFVLGSNPLRRIRNNDLLLKHLWPKLELVVVLDYRMTSTTMHADIVLPAAAWYERDEHKWVSPLMPYIHSGEKAVDFYEARSDWQIISRLTETLDNRAAERGITEYKDRWGETRTFEGLYKKFSNDGKYGHEDDSKVCKALLDQASNIDIEWEDLKKKGFARFTDIGHGMASIGNMTEMKPNETITPLTKHVFDKVPYPTLSRRIQFYIDHELYLEMGEELPVHKDPPTAGGDYPLFLSSGHTRWSIHSVWRDQKLLLRLQRGEPCIFMGPENAKERGIVDGSRVRIYNDLNDCEAVVKLTHGVRSGQIIIYHAWETYQFKNGKGIQAMTPSPINPVELSGGQFHLRPSLIQMQPGHTDRDTRVEVELV